MLTLQQIADQIIADPTLRVVFVAATTSSADAFLRGITRRLESTLEIVARHNRWLGVGGWDKISPTVWTIRDGGTLCGTRCDLMIYEYRGKSYYSDARNQYRCHLTARGKEEIFDWDCEPSPFTQLPTRSGLP